MSRVGNKPIFVPEAVEFKADGQTFSAKGKLGELSFTIPDSVSYKLEDGVLNFSRSGNKPNERAAHGLARAMVNNIILGVTEGFRKDLEIEGTGYKWEVRNNAVVLTAGFSHPVEMPIPDGLQVETKGGNLSVVGIDKQLVGFFAAQIKRKKPVEPYKGKGIKYKGQFVRRKAGKAGA
jgi:large subunit ribosomal protein L6